MSMAGDNANNTFSKVIWRSSTALDYGKAVITMSLILVEDPLNKLGDIIVSCWDEFERVSMLLSGNKSLDECLSQVIQSFECRFERKPVSVSVHKIDNLVTSQVMGVNLD